MTSSDDTPREPDAREQLDRWLAFLARARGFWPVPLFTLLFGAIAFGVFSYVRTPKYRSETVILYIERGSSDTAESSGAERSVTVRLKELLLSRPQLERVVSKFDLYSDVKREYGLVDAVEELKKHIEFRAPGGDTFSIAFEGTSATQAQRVTAELGRLVIDGDSALRKNQAKVSLDFLASEKQAAETALRETEQKLASFMALHPRFALDATPLANGVAIRATLAPPTPARPAAAAAPWSPRARDGALGSVPKAPLPATAGIVSTPGPGGSDAEESRARAALAAAREHLTEQLTRYTPAHPDVRAAEAAVQRATQRLAGVAGAEPRPSAPVAAPAPVAAAPPPVASAVTAAPRSRPAVAPTPVVVGGSPNAAERTQDLVDLETQWLQLTRAVTEARQRQDQIEAQFFRADMQAGSEAVGHGVQVTVIDPAFLPERPLPPGRTTIALMFAAAALALGLLGALLLAAFDERLFSARDVAGITEVLVEVPSVTQRSAHVPTG